MHNCYAYIHSTVWSCLNSSVIHLAITSDCVNLCKIEKGSLFTHFCSKKTHISWGKIVHLCTIATVAVHICTATVACAYHILFFFSLSPSLLLSIPLTLNSFVFSIGSEWQTLSTLSFSHLIPLASMIADCRLPPISRRHYH